MQPAADEPGVTVCAQVLLQHAETGAAPSLAVYKDGANVLTVTPEGELEPRIRALLAHVGWSPGAFAIRR